MGGSFERFCWWFGWYGVDRDGEVEVSGFSELRFGFLGMVGFVYVDFGG